MPRRECDLRRALRVAERVVERERLLEVGDLAAEVARRRPSGRRVRRAGRARSRSRPPARAITATAPSQCSAASSQREAAPRPAPPARIEHVDRLGSRRRRRRRGGGGAPAPRSGASPGGCSIAAAARACSRCRRGPLSPRVERLADERVREAVGRAVAAVELDHELRVAAPPRAPRSARRPRQRRASRCSDVERALAAQYRGGGRALDGRSPRAARGGARAPPGLPRARRSRRVSARRSSARRARTATPVSMRCRSTSSTKNGLPSVCSWTVPTSDGGRRVPGVRGDQRADVALAPGPRARSAPRAGRGAGRRAAPPADATARTSASR